MLEINRKIDYPNYEIIGVDKKSSQGMEKNKYWHVHLRENTRIEFCRPLKNLITYAERLRLC